MEMNFDAIVESEAVIDRSIQKSWFSRRLGLAHQLSDRFNHGFCVLCECVRDHC